MTPECILACGDILGEVPVWDESCNSICWIDVSRGRWQTLDMGTRHHATHQLPGQTAGGWAFRTSGGIVIGLDNGIFGFDDGEVAGPRLAILPPEELQASHRINESTVDPRGRLWMGVMDRNAALNAGGLYRIDVDGSVSQALEGITTPNGICFDPAGTTMYFADSRRKLIWAFDYDADEGALGRRRVFCDLSAEPGIPDGAAMDAEGHLWNACFGAGRVIRIDPKGRITRSISLPVEKVSSVAFGGPHLQTLFMTTASGKLSPEQLAAQPLAGGLFALEVDVEGLAPRKFGG